MSEEHKRTKEDEDPERLRREYPHLNTQLTPEEERPEHRVYVGKRAPVAKIPEKPKAEGGEEADE